MVAMFKKPVQETKKQGCVYLTHVRKKAKHIILRKCEQFLFRCVFDATENTG